MEARVANFPDETTFTETVRGARVAFPIHIF